MLDNNTIPAEQYSFKDFLFKNRRNRITLIIAAVAIVIQFAVFKYFYPFANFIHNDSFAYLRTAHENLDINVYMVGYSRFLRLFSVFTSSDTILVAFQYLFAQGSALFFLFTLFYFYKPSKIVQVVLLCFMIINPLFLYMANLVSSDCFFLALSLLWFTFLLWTIHMPSTRILIWNSLVLFIAFTVRYNALIYPIITIGVMLMSKLPIHKKITGLSVGILLCGLFVLYTGNKYKSLTGIWQYSPFSGWQLANNAMYTYRYVDSIDRKPVPAKFKKLDNMVRAYFDSSRDIKKYPNEAILASTHYMWSHRLPLHKYMHEQFIKDTAIDKLKIWASMGPFYADYGMYIIKKYPQYFVKYFLWPNANKYYAPPIEYLDPYNMGADYVLPIAQGWFQYKSTKVTSRMKNFKGTILGFYPILTGLMNMVLFCSSLGFILLNGFQYNTLFRKGLILGIAVWLVNAGFTIVASSVALRFQAFPIMLTCTFSILLVDWLLKRESSMDFERSKHDQKNLNSALLEEKSFSSEVLT
jgi:hypothetical protein